MIIEVPPLRERREDFPRLVSDSLEQLATEMQLPQLPVIDPSDMHALLRYPWPGNVRELRNVLERALILWTDGPLRLPLQPFQSSTGSVPDMPGLPHVRKLTEVTGQLTESLCLDALRRCGGNKKKCQTSWNLPRHPISLHKTIWP